jgi:hypothetical protein
MVVSGFMAQVELHSTKRMADVIVALQARGLPVAGMGFDGLDNRRVTFAAGQFGHLAVPRRDAQRVGKIARGEIQ